MQIEKTLQFQKAYNKLPSKFKTKVDNTLKLFIKDPFHSKLKNHRLKGKLIEFRAISVTGDIRIIFKEKNNYTIIILLNVGPHSKVYK